MRVEKCGRSKGEKGREDKEEGYCMDGKGYNRKIKKGRGE